MYFTLSPPCRELNVFPFPTDLILPSLLVGAPGADKTSFWGATVHFLSCLSLPHSILTTFLIPVPFLHHSVSTVIASDLSKPPNFPSTLPQAGLLCDWAGHPAWPPVPQTHRVMGVWGVKCQKQKPLQAPGGWEKFRERKGSLEGPPGGSGTLGEALPSEHLCPLSLLGGRDLFTCGERKGPLSRWDHSPKGTRDSRALNSTTNGTSTPPSSPPA